MMRAIHAWYNFNIPTFSHALKRCMGKKYILLAPSAEVVPLFLFFILTPMLINIRPLSFWDFKCYPSVNNFRLLPEEVPHAPRTSEFLGAKCPQNAPIFHKKNKNKNDWGWPIEPPPNCFFGKLWAFFTFHPLEAACGHSFFREYKNC